MDIDVSPITVTTIVAAPVSKVWEYWTTPEHICKWNNASDDWHTPRAENDLHPGGKFSYRMEARDGSFGFDFGGVYDVVLPEKHIAYTMEDGRKVAINFIENEGSTEITESFDPENVNSQELQRTGWQAILDNFKKHVDEN
jgi:uncharacterized protein YndB with AHSA1/START domain